METLDQNEDKIQNNHAELIKNSTKQEIDKISKGSRFRKIITKTQEITLTLCLCILPWLSFTYTNFINFLCGVFLIKFVFDIKYKSLPKIRKTILTMLLVLNITDNIIRIIFLILFKLNYLDYEQENNWKELNITLKIYAENFSLTFFHFLISFVITLSLMLHIIYKNCFDSNPRQEYILNIKTLKRMHNIKDFLLLFSFALTCVSASIKTNFISFLFVLVIFFILILWVIKCKNTRKVVHRNFSFFMLIFLSMVLISEYLLNIRHIYAMVIKNPNLVFYFNMIWVTFFYNGNKEDPDNFNVRNFISLCLLVIVVLINSLYLKCRDYKLKIKNYDRNQTVTDQEFSLGEGVTRKKIFNHHKKNDKKEDEINLYCVSHFEDGDILLKLNDNNKGIFKVLRIIIKNYLYSPFFILHFCRIGIIVWLRLFQSYCSLIYILWLFRSFTIKSTNKIIFITNYIVFPLLIFDSMLCYFVNIPGVEIISYNLHNETLINDLGLVKYSDQTEMAIKIIFRLLVTYLFSVFVFINKSQTQTNSIAGYPGNSQASNNLTITTAVNKEINESDKNLKRHSTLININQIINNTSANNNFLNINTNTNINGLIQFNENNLSEPLMIEIGADKFQNTKAHKFKYILSFSEILLKLLFTNIDKISMLFVYLECVKFVNIAHLILMIIFFIQLSSPRLIQKICVIVICILELIIFSQFLWGFISNKLVISDNAKDILHLFFLNPGDEITFQFIYLWIALYCFYIEYQSYSSKIFEVYKYKKLDMYEYINYNLAHKQLMLKILTIIFDITSGIYIWILFFSYGATIFFMNTNLLQGIKLITFLVVISMFTSLLERNFTTKIKETFSAIWTLIIISGIISISIYVFQFLELDLLNKFYFNYLIDFIPNCVLQNSKLIGYELYHENMKYSIIPYYASNLLSALIYQEVSRLILKKTRRFGSTSVTSTSSIVTNPNEAGIYVKYFYKFMFALLKYYWIVVFISVFWLSISWKLSISMLGLMIVIIYNILKCYSEYYKSFNSNCEKLKYITNYQKMLKNYSEEKESHYKVSFHYRKRTFNILLSISMIYIAITYFCSFVIDFEAENDFYLLEIHFIEYFVSFSYLLGFYYSNHDFRYSFFFQAVFGYILIIFLLIVEKVFQAKCFEYFSKNKILIGSKKTSLKILKNLEQVKEEEVNKLRGKSEQITSPNNISDYKTINDPLSLTNQHTDVNHKNEKKLSLKTNMKLFFSEISKGEDKINAASEEEKIEKLEKILDSAEINLPVNRNKSFYNLARQITLEIDEENEFDFNNHKILENSEIKNIFNFPNVFSRKRAQTEADKRKSTDILEFNYLNNIIKINNEDIYLIKSSSSEEEDSENESDKENKETDIENPKNNRIVRDDSEGLTELKQEEQDYEIRTRKRKNAAHQKQKLIQYSLEFQIVLKNIIQEVILFLLLFSAIIKINIFSFLNLSAVLISYKLGNRLRSILYLTCIFIFMFLTQLCLFTTNLSLNTCPTNNVIVLNEMYDFIGIPWYPKTTGYRWGMFFSLGVSKFQISSLWIDIVIMLTIYLYIEFFSFSIFETEFSPHTNKIAISEYEKDYKRISNFSENDYERFKKSMKISFDIDIQDLNKNSKAASSESPDYKVLVNKAYAVRNQNKEKERHFMLYYYKNLKRYIYLTFHNITLIIILIFSMMNHGLISIPYIIFSIVYIYKTHNFLVGNQWTFQHALKYILKPYLFVDLTCQLLCQVPFEFFILYNNPMIKVMNIIGLEKLIVYDSSDTILKSKSFSLVFLKITTYLLISLQEIIYNSNDFKMFILRYHLKMNEKAYIKGKLHAFIFNNSRIMLMNQRIEERKKIDNTLTKIESTLSKWHEKMFLGANQSNVSIRKSENNSSIKKFSRKRNISVLKKDLFNNLSSIKPIKKSDAKSKNKKLDQFSIKKILKKYWLIKIALYLHEQATMLLWSKITTEENVERILKGNMNIKSDLEEAIENFEKDNEERFNFIKHLLRGVNSSKNKKEKMSIFVENSLEGIDNDKGNENFKLQLPEGFSKKDSILSNELNIHNYLTMEIDNEDTDEFFTSTEYYEIKSSIRFDFFKKYSRFRIFRFIIYDILIYFAQNFEYVCYFFMVLNHIVYSCLISLPWPILVFCAGIIHYPRPRKFFWKLSIIYCSLIICLKFFFQISFWTIFFKTIPKPDQYGDYNFKDNYRIGIELYETAFSIKFFTYFIMDFILISVLIAQQFMLIRRGLWSVIETDLESIEEANNRIHKYNARDKSSKLDESRPSELKSEQFDQFESLLKNNEKLSIAQHIKRYFSELFPTLRNEKPGKDLYVYYTLFQMFIIIFIIFFYTKLDQDTSSDSQDIINLKQFSVNMILFAFFHVFLTVLDRYIYLKNLRKIDKIDYNIHDSYSGNLINKISKDRYTNTNYEELDNIKAIEEGDQYEIVYLQYESLQRGLIYKYILQIFLVLLMHILVFFYFPIKGNMNLHNSSTCEIGSKIQKCNEFSNNVYLILFYLIYCAYFVFSGLQIKYNVIDLRKQSVLMRGDNLAYSSIFKTFKAMPFLYEIKLLIDWTFTKTSLDLFKWLKFEATYDLLFITKCSMKSYYGRKLGTKVPRYNKFFSGGLLFFLVLVIVFGPLVLFSSLNPTNKPNQVTGAISELQLVIFKEGVFKNFTLFKTQEIKRMNKISDLEWHNNKFDQIVSTKNYNKDQVQTIEIFENSDYLWQVTPPNYEYIIDSLENPQDTKIYFNLKYSFQREIKIVDALDPYSMNEILIYPPINNTQSELTLFNKIKYSFNNCENSSFVLPKLYNPAIRLGATSKPYQITDAQIPEEDLITYFNCMPDNSKYWQISSNDGSGVTFYTFCDMVSPTTASYNVLTFYLAFVLVIGKFIRTFISGETERVIYTEMPRPAKLLNICEGIKISRYKKDLEREDQLYYVLIDLLRSPEMLKMITKPSIQIDSYKTKRNKVVFY